MKQRLIYFLRHRIAVSVWAVLMTIILAGCSSTRFVPEGRAVLSRVDIKMSRNTHGTSASEYAPYIRQRANARWFNAVKVPLGIYCLSGRDSTCGWNRFVRRLGEAPVLYDDAEAIRSLVAITAAMRDRGYLHATATHDTTYLSHTRLRLTYRLHPGTRAYVRNIYRHIEDDTLRAIVLSDTLSSRLRRGMPLDASRLAAERNRIVSLLRDKGYYYLNKDYVSFRADTLADDNGVDLTLEIKVPPGADSVRGYTPFTLDSVRVSEDVTLDAPAIEGTYRGLVIRHNPSRPHILRRIYRSHTFLTSGRRYNEEDMQDTYRSLNALPPVSYTSVRFTPSSSAADKLNCDIYVKRNRPQTIGAEIEGTNTAGNLGAAVALTYNHRNLLRGAENFSLKLRGAYEAITGLEGYSGKNYTEMSAETSLRFPTLLIPFVSNNTKQGLKATSEVSLMYNLQDRPEFHRRTLTAAWSYRWNRSGNNRIRHRFDPLSINYVFMPWISDTFRKDYLEGEDPRYAVLRYSYENLMIMKMGYSFTLSSHMAGEGVELAPTEGYRLRLSAETAGNLLYGANRLFGTQRDAKGQYTIFGIAYSQYAKVDADFVAHLPMGEQNTVALHAAVGIAVPYGNSSIVPYEKRYFSGGANSVRGWGVRELGPGTFVSTDGKIDFVNHTGNIRLDLSAEYRTHLFWKMDGAAFVDAGNVWNLRDYADQPGGRFRFRTFAEQIAVAYGLGLRLNLDYFILRFDGGMKAIDPMKPHGREHYPLLHPRMGRDFTFHFAVGLPF